MLQNESFYNSITFTSRTTATNKNYVQKVELFKWAIHINLLIVHLDIMLYYNQLTELRVNV